jgi:hypothetical protein
MSENLESSSRQVRRRSRLNSGILFLSTIDDAKITIAETLKLALAAVDATSNAGTEA